MEWTLVGVPTAILHDGLAPIKLKDGPDREDWKLSVTLGLPSHQ
jgi:hypothetical protein